MSKNWLAVVCAEHVRRGRAGGFMQVCHGKVAPLRRMQAGDRIVYYSPTVQMGGKDKLQSLTAIGVIAPREPYQVTMSADFQPYRRDVMWAEAKETPIAPLLTELEWTRHQPNWGYSLRFGVLEISAHDMDLIAAAMAASFGLVDMQRSSARLAQQSLDF